MWRKGAQHFLPCLGGMLHTDSFVSAYRQSANVFATQVDSRTIADLDVKFSNDSITIGLYATNLFNTRTLTNQFTSLIAGVITNPTGVFERPRTVGANVSYKF